MSPVTSTLLGLCIGALFSYALLKYASYFPARSVDHRQIARTHGLWTAVIALFASGALSNQRFSELGPVRVEERFAYVESQEILTVLLQTAIPMIALGGIYILAQLTWPGHKELAQTADLTASKMRDLLPRNLTLVTASVAILTASLIAAAAFLPEVSGGFKTHRGIEITAPSRVDGIYFSTVVGSALIVLLLGVMLAVLVIVRRRRIPALSVDDDILVRKIAINRLLRTAILTLTGMINAIAAYAANGLPANLLGSIDTAAFWGVIVNPIGFFSVAILVMVVVWAPPALVDRSPEPAIAPLATAGS